MTEHSHNETAQQFVERVRASRISQKRFRRARAIAEIEAEQESPYINGGLKPYIGWEGTEQ